MNSINKATPAKLRGGVKSTKQLMADFIRRSDCESCKVCLWREQCNEKFATDETYEPSDEECTNGIINYFERLKYADTDEV